MRILFICKHNRFRSKVAEAIFKKLNKNKKNKAESRGLVFWEANPYVADIVVKIMKKRGYKIGGKSKLISKKDFNNFDLIVIVADNVYKKSFKDFNAKIIKWNVPDTNEKEIKRIKEIIRDIEKRVIVLLEEINK